MLKDFNEEDFDNYQRNLRKEVLLKDLFYNFSENSGSTDEYCYGIIISFLTVRMTEDNSITEGLKELSKLLPKDCRKSVIDKINFYKGQ